MQNVKANSKSRKYVQIMFRVKCLTQLSIYNQLLTIYNNIINIEFKREIIKFEQLLRLITF